MLSQAPILVVRDNALGKTLQRYVFAVIRLLLSVAANAAGQTDAYAGARTSMHRKTLCMSKLRILWVSAT
jgi:hypothetical protein